MWMLYSRDRNSGGGRPFGSGPVPFDSSEHKEHAGLYLEPIGSTGTKLWPVEFLALPSTIIGMNI